MTTKESSPKRLSRREFLRVTGLAAIGGAVTACLSEAKITTIEPSPSRTFSPTQTPTVESKPDATRTSVPTKVPTAESPKPTTAPSEQPPTVETLPVAIPTPEIIPMDELGLRAERYSVQFPDVSHLIPPKLKEDLKSWMVLDEEDKILQPGLFPVTEAYGYHIETPHFLLFYQEIPDEDSTVHSTEVLYDKEREIFYSGIIPDHKLSTSGNIERQILGDDIFTYAGWKVTDDGKVVYPVVYDERQNEDKSVSAKNAIVIADVRNGTKTYILDTIGRTTRSYPYVHLGIEVPDVSDNGRLLFSLDSGAPETSSKKVYGAYVIDGYTGKIIFHYPDPDNLIGASAISSDGRKIYLTFIGGEYAKVIDIESDKERFIPWHAQGSVYGTVVSNNLDFIALQIGVFSSTETEAGQWGANVATPDKKIVCIRGFNRDIAGKRSWSIVPWRILDDGTLFASDMVFRYMSGRYVYEQGPAKPDEIKISQYEI